MQKISRRDVLRRVFGLGALSLTTACSSPYANMALTGDNYSQQADDLSTPSEPVTATPQAEVTNSLAMKMVDYHGVEPYGTILINIADKHLYFINGGGTAMQFPVAVGRAGKQNYDGEYRVARKVEGPTWTPTTEMVANNPNLEAKAYPAGPNNPLGSHAVYFDYIGGGDSQLRAHGTNDPDSIGKEVSSGCFRMFNSHAENLYHRAEVGAKVKTYTTAGLTPGISAPQEYTVSRPSFDQSGAQEQPNFNGIGLFRRLTN